MAVFHSRLVIMISHDIFSFSYSNFNFSYSDFVVSRSDFPISHSDFSISHIDHWDSIGDFQLNPLLSCLACHISLLKKIYKRDAPFRAVFKVKTLAVLFSPYPRKMKHIPRNLKLPPFWRLLVSIEMVLSIPTRALSRARGLSMRTHLSAVEIWARLPAAVRERSPRTSPEGSSLGGTCGRDTRERRKLFDPGLIQKTFVTSEYVIQMDEQSAWWPCRSRRINRNAKTTLTFWKNPLETSNIPLGRT